MNVLEVVDLRKYFPIRRGFLRRIVGHVRAVDGVSFHIRKGETLALVGESGCGKTTVSRCILRALAPTSGAIEFTVDGKVVDLATLSKRELKRYRRHMQMVFQDPFSSLNPRMGIADIIGEPLLVNGMRSAEERRKRVAGTKAAIVLGIKCQERRVRRAHCGQMRVVGHRRQIARCLFGVAEVFQETRARAQAGIAGNRV